METYNYGRTREHGVAVASWIGTYRLREIKRHGDSVEYVQHGSVPVLQYCQAHQNVRSFFGCRTAMNNANTVG